jgi:pimeloyl-ACP methyl ester carboxylesterase
MTDDSKVRDIRSWAILVGQWTIADDGSAKYLGKQAGEHEYGTVLSNVRFSGGTIRASFRQETGLVDGRILLGAKSESEEYFAIGLGGYGNAYTFTHFLGPAIGWKRLVGVGFNGSLDPNHEYQLNVRLDDSRIALYVDDVCVIDHPLAVPIPYGQIGLLAWGDGPPRKFSNVEVERIPSDIEHVVVLVHGIRTHAEWQAGLRREFAKKGIVVAPTNYGYFDLFRFLAPVPWLRNRAVARMRDLVQAIQRDYPKAQISFLAHSFGTYVVSRLLQQQRQLKAHRIVFCGSVVPYDFPIEEIREQFAGQLLNEVSARDPWPVTAKNITFGYGAVGTQGFNNPRVYDRWHQGFGHSQYLTTLFCEAYWIPFFENGQIVETPYKRETAPLWCRFLRIPTNKFVFVPFLLLAILAFPYIYVRDETPAANQRGCLDIATSTSKEWREKYLLADRQGTYYVIVKSEDPKPLLWFMNSLLWRLDAYKLRKQYPTVDFDSMHTSSRSGDNQREAIVLARGLSNASDACRVRAMANACGISQNAYPYRLGFGLVDCRTVSDR